VLNLLVNVELFVEVKFLFEEFSTGLWKTIPCGKQVQNENT
jgi:hypothetical protein